MSRKTATGRVLRDMDPDTIYFTHARVRPVFTGCNKRIQDTLDEIVAGTTKVTDIPYITVIENFERPAGEDSDAEEEEDGRKRKKGGGGRKGKGAKKEVGEATPFYFSLNNRRLFLFKTLKQRGLIDTVAVQVKPALERERTKYTRERWMSNHDRAPINTSSRSTYSTPSTLPQLCSTGVACFRPRGPTAGTPRRAP
ncbi:uncharacterized protein CcaverHIS019_0501030 [Cutaneotrichosporon cavernicola]|uniref:Uncharacterized protein n=1 Tax=Cutaneotrichosporon cavernicola TaxID=279322 RepID=A0AA48QWK8_9TREE|nr:uncharacterized protein CcaverHIS019_0501030 [Cutaneotrichosporon cavernicola]BEI92475.1 hypothetical protein CcaverHIS019_0501030 [Cutaneotrichosporon cavernicola]BEJ00247.1 hypothetical protein CcaverHIS631_0501040 [Cutaneotrichosporon cavernicola]BEJ08018.1 hypothetical protein CcaverHIS641_0501030 [Cutaneotrichosporon cavernicola]